MSMYANAPGLRVTSTTKLIGSDRMLDGLIGIVIFVAQILIGVIAVSALAESGYLLSDCGTSAACDGIQDAVSAGFAIAFIGSIIVAGISTLVFLVRLATGRRSWRAPLWGGLITGVLLLIGYVIMNSGL